MQTSSDDRVYRGVIKVWFDASKTTARVIRSKPYHNVAPAKAWVTLSRRRRSDFIDGWVEHTIGWEVLDD